MTYSEPNDKIFLIDKNKADLLYLKVIFNIINIYLFINNYHEFLCNIRSIAF